MTLVWIQCDFEGGLETQLRVKAGQQVVLVEESNRFWWLVRDLETGEEGYVPAEFVESETEHQQRLAVLREAACEDEPWKASGFYRSATAMQRQRQTVEKDGERHRKTVSFSASKPVEHVIPAVSSSSSEGTNSSGGLSSADIDDSPISVRQESSFKRRSASLRRTPTIASAGRDPQLEEMLKKEFGSPTEPIPERGVSPELSSAKETPFLEKGASTEDTKENTLMLEENIIMLPTSDPPPPPVTNPSINKSKAKKRKPSMFMNLFKKDDKQEEQQRQMLRIYAGNCAAIACYKTILVQESGLIGEIAAMAGKKFDTDSCELSLVHVKTGETLRIAEERTLAHVIELAKKATLMEKKKEVKVSAKSTLASPIGEPTGIMTLLEQEEQEGEGQLVRDKKSDFCTNYKFVLNKKNICHGTPFWIKAKILWGLSGNNDHSVRVLTDATMTLGQLKLAALEQVKKVASWEISFSWGSGKERFVLPEQLTVGDVLRLKQGVDPSCLTLCLIPSAPKLEKVEEKAELGAMERVNQLVQSLFTKH